jgi:hypothetical protein
VGCGSAGLNPSNDFSRSVTADLRPLLPCTAAPLCPDVWSQSVAATAAMALLIALEGDSRITETPQLMHELTV